MAPFGLQSKVAIKLDASPQRASSPCTATDTYSLGAVLYELLSGQHPHRFPSSSLADIEKTICEIEPEKPSVVAGKPLGRQLSGDLDNIVLTAMRKEPQRRYASAAEFSEDLRGIWKACRSWLRRIAGPTGPGSLFAATGSRWGRLC